MLDAFPHRRGVLADREAAERGPGKIEGGDLLRMPLAEIAMQAALHDPEQRSRVITAPFPLRLAPRGPAGGARDRLLVVRPIGLGRQAFVEAHEHVASELELDPRGALRRQELRAAVEVATERSALLVDLPVLGERVDLEAAGVGEEASVPRHEPVQAAHFMDQLGTGAQEQVVGVPEDDLGTDGGEIIGRDGLHRAGRADRHELRRVDGAVGKHELSAPRPAIAMGNRELQH